jgi:hypothetical protein
MPLTEIDGEQIIAARLSGEPERKIAKRLGITLADVRDALDRFSATVISHHTRLHRLALDLETIDSMVETFQPMAKAGDVQAGALLAKFLESRRIMLGLELPRRRRPAPGRGAGGAAQDQHRANSGGHREAVSRGSGSGDA